MSKASEFEAVRSAVLEAVERVVAPLVEAGRATLAADAGGALELRPANPEACEVMVYVQSEAEVSLSPAAPGTDRWMTVDVYDEDAAGLVEGVVAYVDAIVAGRVKMTLRRGSSSGRCRFTLSDGSQPTHYYNVWLGFAVGRGDRWETFCPAPY